jgi:protein-ribulosamine 3-kinase
MCESEFESLKVIHAVSSTIAPKVYAWGKFQKDPSTYFTLTEFREIEEQPPDPVKFTRKLTELHRNSISLTDKFDFHVPTCHEKLIQIVD